MASSLRLVYITTLAFHTCNAVPVSNKLVRQQDPLRLNSDAHGNLEVERHVDASGRIIAAGSSDARKVHQQEPAERVHIDSKVRGVEAIEEADRTVDEFRVDSELLPYGILHCEDGENGMPAETTEEMTPEQYDSIVDDIHATIGNLSALCEDNVCPRAEFAGCILRFAGHDFMDYKNGTGGQDGCLNYAEPDNIGLSSCLSEGVGNPPRKLQTSYTPVCANISFADFIVIAAEAVMTYGRQQAMDENSDLEQIDFRTQFKFGRNTSSSCALHGDDASEAVPLPNPGGGCNELERVFIENMGLTWEETAALSGAHKMGRMRYENSGYSGYWGKPSERVTFSNDYFVSMAMKGWKPEKNMGGDATKNAWVRSDHASSDYASFKHKPVMMLDTDMCLLHKDSDNTTLLASNAECCAWLGTDTVGDGGNRTSPPCASAGADEDGEEGDLKTSRGWCCGKNTHEDCSEDGQSPSGPAAQHVLRFAENDKDWIEAFKKAWNKATENGHDDLIWLIAPEHKHPAEQPSHMRMILIISIPIVLIVLGAGAYQYMQKPKADERRPGQQQWDSDNGPMW